MEPFHGTTVISLRSGQSVAIGGDGQVSLGQTIAKADAVKVRSLEGVGAEGAGVLVGFAGSAADSFALLERTMTLLVQSILLGVREQSWRLSSLFRPSTL